MPSDAGSTLDGDSLREGGVDVDTRYPSITTLLPRLDVGLGSSRRYDAAVLRRLALVVALVSCVPEARPPEAPVDFAVPPIGKTQAMPAPGPPAVETCHAIILAGPLAKSSYGCVLDEHITKHQGILTYPCTGDGDAEAAFGEQLYTGRIQDGELDLEVKTEYEWSGDGCRWGTTSNIRGRVTAAGKLAWSYKEYTLRGQNCAGSCTATAAFAVRRQSEIKQPTDDDDDDR